MGSTDIPPFLRDRMKQDVQAKKSDIPPFLQKKSGGEDVSEELEVDVDGQLNESAPITLKSELQENNFERDILNDPFGIKQKPTVNIAGVNVQLKSSVQETAPIPFVSNPYQLASQLQNRINTKTYNPQDVEVVAQSMDVSLPAANAYMDGKVGTGTVIHFDDIKKTKQDELKSTIDIANKELGLSDTYEEVFASPELAGAYIEKIQNIYSQKAKDEAFTSLKQAQKDNPTLFALGSITPDNTQRNASLNAAQKLKSIVSNEIIEQISNDNTLNTDEKVKKIYSLVDNRDKANVERAISNRLSPLRYMVDVATGGNTTEVVDLLNKNKAHIEKKVNETLSDKLNYNNALKRSIAEEYSAKVDSQEISAEDEKARSFYEEKIANIDSENTHLANQIVPNTTLYERYPVLRKQEITNAINEFNAIQSGNVVGYEDGGYEGVTLAEHLAARGFDKNDQVVRDVVNGGKLKDFDFFGNPLGTVANVFTSAGKGLLDLTPIRDEATILAEKKEGELFPTTIGVNDEFQLTEKAKIGQNIANTTAQILGQGLLQWGTGGLGRLAGLTKVAAANTAFFTSGALVGYDSHLKESYDLPIDTDAGRVAYAGINSIFEGAIEKLFPEAKIFQVPGFKDAAVQIASKLSAGELTDKLASELLTKAKNSVLDFAGKYSTNVAKETAEEGLTSAFNSATKLIIGDPNTNIAKAIEDVKNTVIQTAIGTSLIGGFGAHRDVQSERNVSAKSTIYNAAIHHDEALDAINIGFEGKLYDAKERDAKVAVLQTARQSVNIMEKTEQIEGKELKRPERELYVANLTAEAVLTGQKKDMDEVGQEAIDVKLANLKNQRQQILKGEVIIDENGNVTLPAKEVPTETVVEENVVITNPETVAENGITVQPPQSFPEPITIGGEETKTEQTVTPEVSQPSTEVKNEEVKETHLNSDEIQSTDFSKLEKEKQEGDVFRGVESGNILDAEIPFVSESPIAAKDYARAEMGSGKYMNNKERFNPNSKLQRFKIKEGAKILDTTKGIKEVNELRRILGLPEVSDYDYQYKGGHKVYRHIDNITKAQTELLKKSDYDAIKLNESSRDSGVDKIDSKTYAVINKDILSENPLKSEPKPTVPSTVSNEVVVADIEKRRKDTLGRITRDDNDNLQAFVVSENIYIKGKDSVELRKNVNAKYDAELAALKSENKSIVNSEEVKGVTVFHGSPNKEFNGDFSSDKIGSNTFGGAMRDDGFYFTTDKTLAGDYALHFEDNEEIHGKIGAYNLNMKNPLVHDAKGSSWVNVFPEIIDKAKANGHDGVIVKNVIEGSHPLGYYNKKPVDTYVVFDSKQITKISENKPVKSEEVKPTITDLEKAIDLLPENSPMLMGMNKEQSVKYIAEQAQNVSPTGEILEGDNYLSQVDKFGDKLVTAAIAAHHLESLVKSSAPTVPIVEKEKSFSSKARELAAKIRDKGVLPDFLQISDKDAKTQGIGNKEISEALATAIELVADAVDAGTDLAKAISDSFQEFKKVYTDNNEPFDEAKIKVGFTNYVGGQLGTGISNARTEEIRTKYKLGGYVRNNATDLELEALADEAIKNGYNVEDLVQQLENLVPPTGVENFILKKYISGLEAKFESNPTEANLVPIERVVKALDKIGSIQSEAFRTRRGIVPIDDSLAGYFMTEKESAQVDTLTDEQKKMIEKEYNDIKEAEKKWNNERERLNEKIIALQAQVELDKNKSVKKGTTKTAPKTHEEFVSQRDKLRDKLKQQVADYKAAGNKLGIASDGGTESFIITAKMAKTIGEIVKSHVEEIGTKLAEVTNRTFDDVKDLFEGITEKDIHNVIAGNYSEPRQTKNQIAQQIFDLKTEAALVNKLDALLNGEEPNSPKKQVERNKEITALRGKIKDFEQAKTKAANELKKAEAEEERLLKAFEKEQDKAEKARLKAEAEKQKQIIRELNKKTPEEIALQSYKTRAANQIKKLEEDLKNGNFEIPAKTPPIKLDKEALAAKDKLVKLKTERQLRLIKQQQANMSTREKAIKGAAEILNIPRTLMTIVDYSAVLRQGLIQSISHPQYVLNARVEDGKIKVGGAGIDMFKAGVSQKVYDRWFFDIKDTPRFALMEASGLGITDSTNPLLSAREEGFMSNLAEKIPIIGKSLKIGSVTIPGTNLVKGSERSYSMFINKLRVDVFNRFADAMEERGLTFENSPEAFKQMAEYVNNSTGRGSLGKTLNRIAPLLNGIFFSPRLIASRLNMLTYLAQPRFYSTVPIEVRKAYFKDMAKFIGLGMLVIGLFSLNDGGGDEEEDVTVESDPRSSDFGKIRQGNIRWDIWGGFQPFIRVAAQVLKGQRKSTTSGEIFEITGKGAFGKTRADVLFAFARGKLAPVPGMAVDLFSGRTAIGEKVLVDKWGKKNQGEDEITIDRYLKEHLLPLTFTGLEEAYRDKGVKSLFSVGIPSIFGVGTQTFSPTVATNQTITVYKNGKKRDSTPEEFEKYQMERTIIKDKLLDKYKKSSVYINKYGEVTTEVTTKKRKYETLSDEEKKDLESAVSRKSAYLAKKKLNFNEK